MLTAQNRQRMHELLALYARPFRSQEPVVCVGEKSKPLLRDAGGPVAAWAQRHDAEGHGIAWTFTRQDADRKMGQHYVP